MQSNRLVAKKHVLIRLCDMKKELSKQIERIAAEYKTSFNNVVVSMIEACLSDEDVS